MSESFPEAQPPVARVSDLPDRWESLQGSPLSAYGRLEMYIQRDVDAYYADRLCAPRPEWGRDVASAIALSEHLHRHLQATEQDVSVSEPSGRGLISWLSAMSPEVGEAGINDAADGYARSLPDIAKHNIARLNAWGDWLAGGTAATETSFRTAIEALDHADILGYALIVSPPEDAQIAVAYNDTLARLSGLFLTHGKVGLAAAFGSLHGSSDWRGGFIGRLAAVLDSERGTLTDDVWRNRYARVAGALGGSMLRDFARLMPKAPLLRLPNSQIVLADGRLAAHFLVDHDAAQAERYAAPETLTCTLAGGGTARLPFVRYMQREVTHYGRPTERVRYGDQVSVSFDELNHSERAALAYAQEVDLHRAGREEPLLIRLVRDPAGRLRGEPSRPGDTFFAHLHDTEGSVSMASSRPSGLPILDLEQVSPLRYLITSYDPMYSRSSVYAGHVPGFFAPADADAYWIAGAPRQLHARNHPELMYIAEDGEAEPLYTILPVVYYKVQRDFTAAHTTSYQS